MAAVLVVDDDPAIRDVLQELFSQEHACHTAETAEQALTFLESGHCDVAIVDISLPGISGLELLGHIRQRWPRTDVIIITGIDYHQYIGDLMQMGASDYLVKPFQLHDAEATVAQAILRQEGWLDALKESTDRLLNQSQFSAVEVSGGMIDRRIAVRHSVERAARLIFANAPSDLSSVVSAQPSPAIVSHTRDISATGLGLVVPGVRDTDTRFFGVRARVMTILSLPQTMIDVEVSPVRYQWLGEQGGKKSYLIGARITHMSEDDNGQFNEYLGKALAPRF